MRILLRLALLTLCGAGGILLAVHLAASRTPDVSTLAMATSPVIASTATAGELAVAEQAKKEATPTLGATSSVSASHMRGDSPKFAALRPRIAAEVVDPVGVEDASTEPELVGNEKPAMDLTFLSRMSPAERDAAMHEALALQKQLAAKSAGRPVELSDELLELLDPEGTASRPEREARARQLLQTLGDMRRAPDTLQLNAAGAGLAVETTPESVTRPVVAPPSPAPPVAPSIAAASPMVVAQVAPLPPPTPAVPAELVPAPKRITPTDDGRLSIHSRDDDIRNLLEQLAEQAGLNVLAAESVVGTVTVNLHDVTVEDAFSAVLKATGFASRRDGNVLYVGTPADFDAMEKSLDRLATRVYRPNYLNAKELSTMLTPLLTPGTGKISVTSPPATGIAPDNTSSGGDSISQQDAVVIQDYERVLAEVDQVFRELDQRPAQVSIEAVIVSVSLNDANSFGVDFQVLRDKQNVRFGWGSPRQAPLGGGGQVDNNTGAAVGQFAFDTGGLKFAFLDDSLGVFLNALETVGDANVIASPKLLCLNKQKAEILIGQRLGYISTTVTQNFSTQNVEFLDVGAQLRLRPYISSDGLIRMEVHPELSEGEVVIEGGFTLPRKTLTEVTTNVMCPNGCTVIIGGLMRENLRSQTSQVPLLGSLPLAGPLFRSKNEQIERTEILVLLTPRIVENSDIAAEGAGHLRDAMDMEGAKFHRMSPIGRAHLSRDNLLRAQNALQRGDRHQAFKFARSAVHYDPLNREAVRFLNQLGNGSGRIVSQGWGAQTIVGDETPGPASVDGPEVPTWMLDELGEPVPPTPLHPRDPGVPGRDIEIVRPEVFKDDKE